MKIEDYQLLVALKQAGTIRGAAEKLLISQPALSQRLKQVEQHWEETLFIRSHKKLALTPSGEMIIDFAEKTIKEEKELRERVESMSKEISGTLSLGVSSVVGQYMLPDLLQTYITRYPQVKIELQTGLSEVFRQTSEQFHLCIIRGEKPKNLICQVLREDKLYLVEKKDRVQKEKSLIAFQSDYTFETTVNNWFAQHPSFTYSTVIKVDQIETCKQLVAKGIGFAVLPEIAIGDLSTTAYHFYPLMTDKIYITRKTWMCTNETANQLPQVQAFIDMIK
ncbi:LysR family transcriptional regulator [Gracilibacillus sp. S3-1-1]|uniref:LysR family transcriptional regulator n=1 Tax=Gracilibacillus pellucidus TaxID=3095368 RepID=A0ACC6M3Q1_9BACI|nr:LysR family transcriptional regulator [Gracilibacillus sp. S3-1-1]MDX8045559.1 LysR family transcriptional regulator [Gracilibacillus sp. S3-1-1]